MKTLQIDQLRVDGGTQSRASLSQETVAEYAAAMVDGATFPPVVVYYDGTDHWVADGFHRVAASKEAGFRSVEVDVRQGTQRDAILFSVGANGSHGLRRTNADKRRAVETLLRDPEWVKWSDREIAKRCGVGNKFVGDMRPTVSGTQLEPTKRMGADGKERSLPQPTKRTAASDPLPSKPSLVIPSPAPLHAKVDDFDPGPEPEDDDCIVADAEDEPAIAREPTGPRRWGDFELAGSVATTIRLVQAFRDELKAAFNSVDPAFREEFATRMEPTLLTMFVEVRERLPLTARRVEENRAQMRVIDGGK